MTYVTTFVNENILRESTLNPNCSVAVLSCTQVLDAGGVYSNLEEEREYSVVIPVLHSTV